MAGGKWGPLTREGRRRSLTVLLLVAGVRTAQLAVGGSMGGVCTRSRHHSVGPPSTHRSTPPRPTARFCCLSLRRASAWQIGFVVILGILLGMMMAANELSKENYTKSPSKDGSQPSMLVDKNNKPVAVASRTAQSNHKGAVENAGCRVQGDLCSTQFSSFEAPLRRCVCLCVCVRCSHVPCGPQSTAERRTL